MIFTRLDNHNGTVTDIYMGRCIHTDRVPDPYVINVEHVWPRIRGIEHTAGVTDLLMLS